MSRPFLSLRKIFFNQVFHYNRYLSAIILYIFKRFIDII